MNVILNFTSIYLRQHLETCLPDSSILHTDRLESVRGYCDNTSADILRTLLSPFSYKGIHFLDSGNYHYVSLFFLEKIRVPFSLVVFDHHTDMQPSIFGDLLSCGSWIYHAAQTLPLLREILIIGVGQESLQGTKEITFSREKFSILTETEDMLCCRWLSPDTEKGYNHNSNHSSFDNHYPTSNALTITSNTVNNNASTNRNKNGISNKNLDNNVPNNDNFNPITILKENCSKNILHDPETFLHYPCYLSIDKDILSSEEVVTDWDQGSMRLATLEMLCRRLIDIFPILGVDICGEPDPLQAPSPMIKNSRSVNLQLFQLFANLL